MSKFLLAETILIAAQLTKSARLYSNRLRHCNLIEFNIREREASPELAFSLVAQDICSTRLRLIAFFLSSE